MLLVFQFEEASSFGKTVQVIFSHPGLNVPNELKVKHLEEFNYFPDDENAFSIPKISKAQKNLKIDYSAVFSHEYEDVIQQFLAFLNQKYFTSYVVLSHNGSKYDSVMIFSILLLLLPLLHFHFLHFSNSS